MGSATTERGGTALHPTPWALAVEEVLRLAAVDADRGLSAAEVSARRQRYGTNQLHAAGERTLLSLVIDQFKSLVILLLLAAGALAIVFADLAEGVAILAVVVINAVIGFFTEWRAVRSMESLRRMARVETVVMRDGQLQRVPAESLVPGDIVSREAGDIVTADLRLIEAAKLQAKESALTGEAQPVRKACSAVGADAPLSERHNMLYSGTAVTRGSAKGVVVATGLATELGRIAELVATAEPEETPLEKRLDALGARLVRVVAVVALLIAGSGIVVGRDVFLSIEVAIALAVAAIPEGLPVVATIALARGMWRMARRNALIARLSAVETLGTTSIIVTDKTGTLTENRMTVTEMYVAGQDLSFAEICDSIESDAPQDVAARELLQVGALCSNAALRSTASGDEEAVGDPTEVALLLAAVRCGISQSGLRTQWPELSEVPFEPEAKLMATLHARDGGVFYAVKGAPEAVLQICTTQRGAGGTQAIGAAEREALLQQADALGQRGLRTLALASKTGPDQDDDPYCDLQLLGLIGLEDPARAGVAEAVQRCRDAGIRIVMVTGDHAATAHEIAVDTGIVKTDAPAEAFADGAAIAQSLQQQPDAALDHVRVVSRATPEQKLQLIRHFQQAGEIVAMTGDGVNDAPALRKADIGIAMGIRGTAVAKEAAAMVLQDDEFGTIVEAVAQGRAIYDNIRKFVVYLLSCNISEILIVALATLAGAPLPLLPLQILFLNLVTDVFPALALGVGKGSPALMEQPPRPATEALLTGAHWREIMAHGVTISLVVLAAMAIAVLALGFDTGKAVTVSFCTLALAQLWHVFNMRSVPRQFLGNEVSRNPWVWLALGFCLTLILLAVGVESFAEVLSLHAPGRDGWLLIVVMSLVPLLAGAPLKLLLARDT